MSVPVVESLTHVNSHGPYTQTACKPHYFLGNARSNSPIIAPANTMTLTASSSMDMSSNNSPSNPFSLMSSRNTSMSTLPESAVDQPLIGNTTSPVPVQKPVQAPTPEILSPSPSYGNSMGEALARSKGTGLIRRLSRGAHNRLRRRASTTQTNRIRDQSAGSVLVRRRSDSTGTSDFAGDMSDLDLEPHSEDNAEDKPSSYFPPADPAKPSGMAANTAPRLSTGAAFEGGIAPTISAVLEQGVYLLKVTKKKRKQLKFRLDTTAAKVCWDNSNPLKQFYIDDVREIRIGADARSSRQDIQVSPEVEKCWMTIVYDKPKNNTNDRNIKTLHLIAPNEYIVQLWKDALKVVERERIEIMNALSSNVVKSERSMRMAWKQAMARKPANHDQKIDFDDAQWLCRKLEINCSLDTVRGSFNEADRDLVGMLNYTQYEIFVNLFKIRKDIRAIYDAIKPSDDQDVSLDAFLDFLRHHQGVDIEAERAMWEAKFEYYARTNSFRGFETPPAVAAPLTMSFQSFQNFMSSSANPALAPAKPDAVLDRPLNEYFISSSHNTYLLGRQIGGDSSVEAYISALVKGCRCIEVDCWDGRDGRPRVNHGRSFSTEVLFEDCISVISKYAFTTTSYPLIISLEVHCNQEQQITMKEIIIKYFGDALVQQPLVPGAMVLPCPEALRNKILIKVKSSANLDDGQFDPNIMSSRPRTRSRSLSSAFARGTPVHSTTWPVSPQSLKSPTSMGGSFQSFPFVGMDSADTSTLSSMANESYTSSESSENEASTPAAPGKKQKTSKVGADLGALGVYLCGIKYSNFTVPAATTYNHVISFAESTFNNACTRSEIKHDLLEHNMSSLMRVYPAPRRLDSSNFNPLHPWRRGVQMVALNWQTYDINTQINEAMFAAGSDRTGYVLKPDELRPPSCRSLMDPMADGQLSSSRRGTKFVKFSVEIISAQRLPRPRNRSEELGMNPYVEFEMFTADDRSSRNARADGGQDASARDGMSGLGIPVRKRTKILEGNGFDPAWNQTISMTVETKYDSMIFVRWTVWNSPDGRNLSPNDTILAHFTAKLSSLQQGYRHLPLLNSYGERYRDAKLFVKIKKDTPIPLHNRVNGEGHSKNGFDSSGASRMENGGLSWSRRIFKRTPSQRKKSRDSSPLETNFSRTSSMERPLL